MGQSLSDGKLNIVAKMKIEIELNEIKVMPRNTRSGKPAIAQLNTFVAIEEADHHEGDRILICTPDWITHYLIRINSRGRGELVKLYQEKAQR